MIKITCACGQTLWLEAMADNRTKTTPMQGTPKPFSTEEMPYNPPTGGGSFGGVPQDAPKPYEEKPIEAISWRELFLKADTNRCRLEGKLESAERQIAEWLLERTKGRVEFARLKKQLEAAEQEIKILTTKLDDDDRSFYRMRDERDEALRDLTDARKELSILREQLAAHETGKMCQQLNILRAERDQAIKKANLRDEKWKAGIEEVLGAKLDFENPSADPKICASTALLNWAKKTQAELIGLRKIVQTVELALQEGTP